MCACVQERPTNRQRVMEAGEKEGRGGRLIIEKETLTEQASERARDKMILYYTRIKI